MILVSNLDLCPELQNHKAIRMSPCECCHILCISNQHLQGRTHLLFLFSTNKNAYFFSLNLPLLMVLSGISDENFGALLNFILSLIHYILVLEKSYYHSQSRFAMAVSCIRPYYIISGAPVTSLLHWLPIFSTLPSLSLFTHCL